MVRLVGWRGLGITAAEEQRIRDAIERHVHRLTLLLDEVVDVSIHVKRASKQGNKHRYEVNVSVLGNTLLRAEKTSWELRNAVDKAFESIESQVERKAWHTHHFASESVYPEPLSRL